jgi:cytochrome c oxidase subunit IV
MKNIIELFFKAGVPMIYGISWLVGALGFVSTTLGYLLKVYRGERELQLSVVIIFLVLTAVFIFGGYLLVKVAEQEYSKSKKS